MALDGNGIFRAGVPAVLLPGTGSDDDYLRRSFAGPLTEAGATPRAVRPTPSGLVTGYLRELDAAAQDGPIIVGGVSLGAAVATAWALEHPDLTVAVLAALPAWTGVPGRAPASLSARHTAELLRRDGLAATTAAMRATSPGWLADELTRSWSRQWPALPEALEEASAYVAPTLADLERLAAPMGVVAAADDAVHPIAVARDWATAAPHAALRTITFAEFGPRPAALGAACMAALSDALAEIAR